MASPGIYSQEERRRILEYVLSKGVKPSDLGFDNTYIYKARHGKARVSDELLSACLRFLTREELARLIPRVRVEEADATPSDAVRVIRRMQVDPAYRDLVFNMLRQAFGEYYRQSTAWVVGEADIEDFIKAKKLAGRSEKTIRDEVHYIRRALDELGWVLTPDGIREYLASLREDGEEGVLKHTTYSLKSFLKTVLKPRDPALFRLLYDSFTVYRLKPNNRHKLPTIDQLRQVWAQLPSIEAKFYFGLLAETGLRPGEPFIATIDDLDLEHGVLRIGKVTETKRAFIAFLRPEFLAWVRGNYLPRRASFLANIEKAWKASNLFSDGVIENAKRRLIPFEQSRLRREIKETAQKVLGRELELYELRKFFATWMISQGVPESIVNTLQGRAPPAEFRVLIQHYWSPRHEELREWYLKYAPRVCCS